MLWFGLGRWESAGDRAPRREAAPGLASAWAEDLNGDGRVDVLDAQRLHLALEAGRGALDLDANGVRDARDLDHLMRRLVALEHTWNAR